MALEVRVTHLLVRTDSQLVAGEVGGSFQTKDLILIKYFHLALQRSKRFQVFEVCHIPREDNSQADLLTRLTSTKGSGMNKTIIQETLTVPSIEKDEMLAIIEDTSWMTPIVKYL